MTTMLYKCPGSHAIHGGHFDYTIVEDDQIEATLADGWHLTTPAALAAHQAALDAAKAKQEAEAEAQTSAAMADATKPPTREEMEHMATALGLPFDGRTGDKKLAAMIADASSPAADAPQA
jgi:hypothetical protein